MEKGFTLSGILLNEIEKKTGRIAVKYCRKHEIIDVTYDEFISDIRKNVTWLSRNGLNDKKVAILGYYNYSWITLTYSIMCAGSISVPVDKELSAKEISKILLLADAEYIMYEKKFTETAREIHAITGIPVLCFNDDEHISEVQNCSADEAVFCDDEEKIAMFLCTSGTTGQNKVVMLKQKNFAYNSEESRTRIYEGTQKIFLASPLCHVLGIIALCTAVFGGDIICLNEDIRYVTKNFNMLKPSVIYTVPMIAEGLYNLIQNLKNKKSDMELKAIVTAGAALNPDIIHAYAELDICVMQSYGLTESIFASCNYVTWNKPESVGRTAGFCDIKLIDSEVWLAGNSICAGYYNNEAETKKTFIDGWLKTGDLGRIDEDGFLYIIGRIKNLIIRNDGNNVSPEELEQRIISEIPCVQEVIVHLIDNKLTAEIYCGNDTDADIAEKINNDIETINYELPDYKVIERILIRDTPFERTSAKKIKRG